MGQRVNYILIEKDNGTIHYNHWRANCIASDLYLGEKRFLEFVRTCKVVDVLLDEVWIEGCVIIDVDRKILCFWSCEFGRASVDDFYLKKLQNKWEKWSLRLLYNKMYDVEQILNIDYIAEQESRAPQEYTIKEVADDELDEWLNTVVIVKTENLFHITKTGASLTTILNLGNTVIDVLLSKKKYELPKEEDDEVWGSIIIDTVSKQITIDTSECGLWEQTRDKWNGYNFTMGDYGYIGILKGTNIDVEKLVMPLEKINEEFADMVRRAENFDPVDMAKRLLQADNDIKFSPDFFDAVHPKQTLIEKITKVIKRLTRNRRQQ